MLTVFKKKKYILILIKLTIAAFLISYLLKKIGTRQNIFDVFFTANTQWISFVIIMMIPNILLQSYKWWILTKTVSPQTTFWEASASTLGGMSLGVLTPGRIGELGKGLFLENVEKWQIAGLALLDRVFNMTAIMVNGVFAVIYILKTYHHISWFIYTPLAILVALLLILCLYLLLNPEVLRFIYQRFEKHHNLKQTTKQFFSSIKKVDTLSLVKVFLISMGYQMLVSVQFFMIIMAFEPNLKFFDGIISGFATTLAKASLPISIADIGVRETTADYFFGLFIDNPAAIFNGTLLLFFINVLFPSLCGLFMLPKLNFQKDLK